MLLENYEKYQIILTRAILYIVVKISMTGKFKVPPAFKKFIDLCKYGILKFLKEKNKPKYACYLLK